MDFSLFNSPSCDYLLINDILRVVKFLITPIAAPICQYFYHSIENQVALAHLSCHYCHSCDITYTKIYETFFSIA